MVGDTLDADILGAQLSGLHNVWMSAHANRQTTAPGAARSSPKLR